MRRYKMLSLAVSLSLLLTSCKIQDSNSYSPPDYSSHTDANESRYSTTMINDLDINGPVLALREYANPRKTKLFCGLLKDDIWGYDFRSADVSNVDLAKIEDFNDISFNSDTIWPNTLPNDFSPEEILELNKNPGLLIRQLHECGINGNGVGIAIIDQSLYTEHEQYSKKLMSYERIHCMDESASMHGAAVASIAVGNTTGVAPESKLYYVATTYGHYADGGFEFDASILADCILRVCEINRHLSMDNKIRVISISRGYSENDYGYEQLSKAIKIADDEDIFVLTTTTNHFYNFSLCGLERDYLSNPDDVCSYIPASWLLESTNGKLKNFSNCVFVPMGSRSYAASTGKQDYEISYNGGLSWAVPWCAGFYALCCQIKPDVSPTEFIAMMKSTATTVDIQKNGNTQSIKVVNPSAMIQALDDTCSF